MIVEDGFLTFEEKPLKVGPLSVEAHSVRIPIEYYRDVDYDGHAYWNWGLFGTAIIEVLIEEGKNNILTISIPAEHLTRHLDREEVEEAITEYERTLQW